MRYDKKSLCDTIVIDMVYTAVCHEGGHRLEPDGARMGAARGRREAGVTHALTDSGTHTADPDDVAQRPPAFIDGCYHKRQRRLVYAAP